MYPDDDLMRQAMIAQLRGQQAPQPPPDQPPPQPQGLSRQRAVGLLALLTGNRQMGGIGDALVGNANQQEKYQQIERPNAQLAQTRTQQEIQQAGPQAALGGQTPSTFEALTKREQVPKYSADFMGRIYSTRTGEVKQGTGGGAESMLSPEAIDQNAKAYLQKGPSALPNFGRANPVMHAAIIKRAAEMDPTANLVGNQASTKADSGSLGSQQKILDNAEGWERTGKANLGVLLGIAEKLHDTGSPWLNAPVRSFAEKGFGDPNFTAFKAAHATVVNEYAKILSGSQGSAGVTDSARKEADSMLPLDATWEQLSAAAKVLDTDAGNRINSARQQVGQIKGRLGGAPAATEAPSAQQAAPRRRKYNPATGGLE